MEQRVKAKIDGKYKTLGKIKEGKFGPQLSFKKTEELKQLWFAEGDWLNFNLYPDEEPKNKPVDADTQAMLDRLKNDAASEEIPF
jgi:hypothetical protein